MLALLITVGLGAVTFPQLQLWSLLVVFPGVIVVDLMVAGLLVPFLGRSGWLTLFWFRPRPEVARVHADTSLPGGALNTPGVAAPSIAVNGRRGLAGEAFAEGGAPYLPDVPSSLSEPNPEYSKLVRQSVKLREEIAKAKEAQRLREEVAELSARLDGMKRGRGPR